MISFKKPDRGQARRILSFLVMATMLTMVVSPLISGQGSQDTVPMVLPAPWLDDFESGTFGGSTGVNWTTTNPSLSGVSNAISQSGSYSMYTHGGIVSVNSSSIDTSALGVTQLSFWLMRGTDTIAGSEDTDPGDDLEVYYLNESSTWVLLETFLGSGTNGEIMWRNNSLPEAANHANFQVWFNQTGGSGTGYDYWHIDDVYVGPPPPYVMDLSPNYNEKSGNAGEPVYHILTLQNQGASNDTYNLSGESNWPLAFRDMADTTDITNISLSSGNSTQFIARVSIPGGALSGDFDLANVTAISQNDTSVNETVKLFTALPFANPWLDNFEIGTFGGSTGMNWTSSMTDTSYFGVSTDTANSGSYSMYTSGGPVTLDSWMIDTSNLTMVELDVWVRKGGAFSDVPENSEDLNLYYKNLTGDWKSLDTFLGGGTVGEIFERSYALPSDAVSDNLQIRFEQTSGTASSDYWHIDDVYVGPPPPYKVDLEPEVNASVDSAGGTVDYILNVTNLGTMNDTYDLYNVSVWPVIFRDIGDAVTITNISVNTGITENFIARVTIPGLAVAGDSDLANVTATSQNDTLVNDTVQITTDVSFTVPWLDDFEFGVFGGSTGFNWTSDDASRSGVSTQTSNSGTWSMYTTAGVVNVESWFIDTSGLPVVEVQSWIRMGGLFSEYPDSASENLELYYMNDIGAWVLMETFFGGGTPGEIFDRSYLLPAEAIHPLFQIRFSQTGGSGGLTDYWHIDDVYVGEPVPEVISTIPLGGSIGIPIDQNVTVVFDETMDTSDIPTISQTTGTDPGGWSFVGWSTTNATDDTATWTHNDWSFAQLITLEVSGGSNPNGTSTLTPYTWNFTTYVPDNVDPIVDAGPDAWENSVFTQYGTATDAGSGVERYEWVQVSGPGTITFGNPNSMQTTVEADTDGTYEISFTAFDYEGNSAIDSFILVWDTIAPLVDAGPDRLANNIFTQYGTVVEEGSGVDYYTWMRIAGAGHITFGSSGQTQTTITADTDRTYTIRLTVIDLAGNTAYDEFTLVWDTEPPIVMIRPSGEDVPVGTDIIFSFNEEMDRGSVEAGMKILRNNGGTFIEDDTVTGTFIWNDDGSRVVFRPDDPLAYGTEYNVTLSGAVSDLAGNRMDNMEFEVFTTEYEPIPPTGDIKGQIVDANGNPIEGALVQIVVDGETFSQITDADGEFELVDVPVGTHDMVVTKGDHNITVPVLVSDGQTNNLNPIELDTDDGASTLCWILIVLLVIVLVVVIFAIANRSRGPPQQMMQAPPQQYQQPPPPPPPPPGYVQQPVEPMQPEAPQPPSEDGIGDAGGGEEPEAVDDVEAVGETESVEGTDGV
ncbi:MAG: Ig-like domain-containing protein [Thermoplasmata archaeon]|nr:Ig-like domain-containing protein [Thermoplasmata archaeon]